jgi:hypothetical protein
VLSLFAGGGVSAAPPQTSCPAYANPVAGLSATIDTNAGCNNPNGTSFYPITGWVAYNPGAGVNIQLLGVLEGLSTHQFYWGNYVLCLYPSYGAVSQTCTTYHVMQNTGSYPSTPPTVTPSDGAPTITGGPDGSFIAQYTLQAEQAPSGHLNSVKTDFWAMNHGTAIQGGHTATQAVKPPSLVRPPASIWLGYADNYSTDGDPAGLPWTGMSNTLVIGCGINLDTGAPGPDNCPQLPGVGGDAYDSGAIRIDNPNDFPLEVSFPSVTISTALASCSYHPWPAYISVPSGSSLVLTMTNGANPCPPNPDNINFFDSNFNTSESFFRLTGQSLPPFNCTPDGAVPVVMLTLNGRPVTIRDTGQILNTGGIDPLTCTPATPNEFHAFVQVLP